MKKIIFIICLVPTLCLAQNSTGMTAQELENMQNNMQSMMKNMEKVEQCMKKVDQKKLDKLGLEASKFERQISKLCQQGKKQEAQNKAISFGKKIKQNKELNKMNDCMKSMKSIMPPMPFNNLFKDLDSSGKHVCG